MILCFTLSMPNRASWNGRWSGEDKFYAMTRTFRNKEDMENANKLLHSGYFHYNFGDGWSAGISVRKVNSKEAATIRKKSAGFSGYDWMVDSIIKHGRIQTEE